ncbi:MAG: hypothetical protein AB9856_02885 [Cellulosilyticaceae bacterium]
MFINIEDALKALTDGRKNAKYTTSEAVLPGLLGFIMRIQSFNELKYKIRSNEFKNIASKRMKLPPIDTIRDTLKVTNTQRVYKMHNEIFKKAKRNKVFEEGTIDGYTVAAIDGTKLFGSYKKSWGKGKINLFIRKKYIFTGKTGRIHCILFNFSIKSSQKRKYSLLDGTEIECEE